MYILSPETDNCPSWISGRERMTEENISWSISTKECCRPRRGLNPRPPCLQSECASNFRSIHPCVILISVHLSIDLCHVITTWLVLYIGMGKVSYRIVIYAPIKKKCFSAQHAGKNFWIFVYFFPQKICFDISCKLHEMSKLIFWENKKKISSSGWEFSLGWYALNSYYEH